MHFSYDAFRWHFFCVMFERGEKVLCIDDSVKDGVEKFAKSVFWNWVKKDSVYTIREFLDNKGIVTGVLLEEIHNFPIWQPLLHAHQEPAFRLDRFVKHTEQKQERYVAEKNTIFEDVI